MNTEKKHNDERYSIKALKKNKKVQKILFVFLSAVLTALLLFVALIVYLLVDFYI